MISYSPKADGFSMVEIMIVLAIIAILSAIALPSYMDNSRKSNREDARSTLMLSQTRLERCFTSNRSYINSAETPCEVSEVLVTGIKSSENLYDIDFESAPAAATYTLRATAIAGPQTSDTDCLILTLNNVGATAPAECW